MTDPTQGVQSLFNFWLGLIPQLLGPFAGMASGAGAKPGAAGSFFKGTVPMDGLVFPADQFAKAATMTQQSLQALAQTVAPMWQGAGVNPFAQWMTGAAGAGPGAPAGAFNAATGVTQAMLEPWTKIWSQFGAPPASAAHEAGARGPGPSVPSTLPLQAISQAWLDFGSRLAGATPAEINTAFDRTYGALNDALGLGPARQLQTAWQDMLASSVAHQEARANYAMLVQTAFAQGIQRLMTRLAEKASAGEHVDSVLAMLRLWAVSTEEAVHQTLQSPPGLAATAAMTRTALAYRKKMQHVAAITGEMFDVATTRDLDDAYREIQALKRELRAMRAARDTERSATQTAGAARTRRPTSRKGRSKEDA